MAGTSSRTRTIDGIQGIVALAGISFGLIPLVRWIFSGEHGGLFRWAFGTPTGTMGYLAPLAVIAVLIGLIALLEVLKRRA